VRRNPVLRVLLMPSWAASVLAGMIRVDLSSTAIAAPHVPAERGCSAGEDDVEWREEGGPAAADHCRAESSLSVNGEPPFDRRCQQTDTRPWVSRAPRTWRTARCASSTPAAARGRWREIR
jgi:hypothetical protein